MTDKRTKLCVDFCKKLDDVYLQTYRIKDVMNFCHMVGDTLVDKSTITLVKNNSQENVIGEKKRQ